jgi:Tfp pilus assembly protein PilF
MISLSQLQRLVVVALLASLVSGCQSGIASYVPQVKMPEVFAKDEQKVPAVAANFPAPKVTEKNYAQVQLALGDSLAKEGNFEAAQAAYEAALRNDDSLARAYHKLALVHEKTGHGDASKDLFLRAMKLDPKNAEIICDYGYWCYLRQDWIESERQFQRALNLDPTMKRAHNNLALVYTRTGRPSDALRHSTFAGLSSADAHANLGLVYLTQKRLPQARIELERAVAENPNSSKAKNVLASLDKVEANAAPVGEVPVSGSGRLEHLPPITASLPANRSATEHLPPVAVSSPATRPKPEHLAPVIASSPTPAPRPERLPSAYASSPAALPPAKPQPHVAIASRPANPSTGTLPATTNDLPTQTLSPVLSDYPVWTTVAKPASRVELTEFAARPQATAATKVPEKPSRSPERSIRFLPQSAGSSSGS